jgi:DNA mismatch endonuclease, patch repair protein
MSRIRGKDTTPERIVRSLLHRLGYRFRLHVRIPITTKHTKLIGRKKAQSAQNNSLSASTGDLSCLGSNERNSPEAKARCGPSEWARASHWVRMRCRISRAVSVDILLPKHKIAIFVHGCFWHRHKHCKNCTTPTHRRDWWLKKLNGNAARDRLHQRALRKLGWRPIVIWECQTEKPEKLARLRAKLERTLSAAKDRKDL